MAAVSEAPFPEIVDLQRLGLADLDPLFEDEIRVWDRRFAWDFRSSADLLRRFVQIRSLYGYAICARKEIVGYSYYVCEGRKGLIGDFYVRSDHATFANESALLGAVVQALMVTSGVRRIESQLMLLQSLNSQLPFQAYAARHDRYFMVLDRDSALRLQLRVPAIQTTFVPWADRYQEEVAHLVCAAYKGHVDSDINDQYRTIPGARQFLSNIVRFPGCGQFAPAASVLAIDDRTGRLCGASLASLVSTYSGHVTQLCVLPGVRGAHLGYELLRECLKRLVALGCASVSLTVTCSNIDAVRLYQSIGFQTQSVFPALVWERW